MKELRVDCALVEGDYIEIEEGYDGYFYITAKSYTGSSPVDIKINRDGAAAIRDWMEQFYEENDIDFF